MLDSVSNIKRKATLRDGRDSGTKAKRMRGKSLRRSKREAKVLVFSKLIKATHTITRSCEIRRSLHLYKTRSMWKASSVMMKELISAMKKQATRKDPKETMRLRLRHMGQW